MILQESLTFILLENGTDPPSLHAWLHMSIWNDVERGVCGCDSTVVTFTTLSFTITTVALTHTHTHTGIGRGIPILPQWLLHRLS